MARSCGRSMRRWARTSSTQTSTPWPKRGWPTSSLTRPWTRPDCGGTCCPRCRWRSTCSARRRCLRTRRHARRGCVVRRRPRHRIGHRLRVVARAPLGFVHAGSDCVRRGTPARCTTRATDRDRHRDQIPRALREGEASAGNKSGAIQRHEDQTAFLVDIAERSGVFAPGWHDRVLTTDLRQIWRDHLLALSMRQHPDRWTGETRYALLYPRRNVSFADAARRYAGVLNEGATSFLALAIEDVVEAAFTHGGPTGEPFRRRYLW